ncbi:MAG: HEAT repeat domain-containing protein [Verrucomicrobia bacterium]|nr:HEAT repeat domain-containing protein [Verrucomicrobiota bacterium]
MILRLLPRLFSSLILAATAAFAQSTLVLTPPAGAAGGKHVVLLSGDEEYRSEEALPQLAKILSQRHGFKCTVLFALDADGTINPDNQQSLPGAEALDSADVIVMSLRFRAWPDEVMKRFEAAYLRGTPMIALRTSTHAFNFPAGSKWADYSWNARSGAWPGGFGKHVLGETWISHWGRHKFEATRTVVEPDAAKDPLLRGVGEILCTSDVYEAAPPADARVLLRGLVLKGMNRTDAPADTVKKLAGGRGEQPVNSPAMPVAWTRSVRNEAGRYNKIFTTTMGAASDLADESLRRLIVNAVYWATGPDIPARADVTTFDSYTPRVYGFKGYRTQLRPADHALGKVLAEGGPPPPQPAPPAAKKKNVSTTAPASTAAAGSVAAAPASAPPTPDPKSQTPDPKPQTPSANGAPFTLNVGDRVAIVGNALADRMQHHGWLETMIHAKHPAHRIVVRNLAFAGDEVTTRARSKDFGTPDEWLAKVQAGVVFSFFGYNESFAGADGLPKFKEDLGKFIADTRAKNYGGTGAPRLVIFSPIAAEKHPDSNFAYDPKINENLAAYTQAMREVCADQAGVTFVDLMAPSQQLYAEAAKNGQPPLTINGVHLSSDGEAKLTQKIYPTLFGDAAPAIDTPATAELRAAVNAKNEMWHSHYRSVDGYNIYGDRSKIAYVSHPDTPKITNTQIMMEEMAQRDAMTTNLERRAWAIAAGKSPSTAEQVPLPVVTAFGTNKPGSNIDGTYPFVDGDEAIAKMTLAPGLKANLFASEKQFPELAKAVQMVFDTKGRLWIAAWPSYPELTPTARVKDKILILEDTDKDGRADKCTVWLDGLNCPTGFQFYKDGILLVQAPNLLYVRDVGGRGQIVERVLMGLDSADSHHTANSLVYEPGGALLLSDGVFHRTQVESVTGAVRNLDGAIHRYEPLTGRFEVYASYGFANPHGRAFDYWGNDIITDATGNNTYWGPAFSGRIDYPAKHPKLKTIWDRPSRPSAGSTILTSRHFPDEYWGDYLNPNCIGFQGIYRVHLSDDGAGIQGKREPDIVQSKDFNFRPIDTATGPDGALYICDWHNPLIGHLQSHLRDSNRDHEHGRIYRITAEGRPLTWQPKIDGEPIPALLDLLKREENQIRNLAKIELAKHPTPAVLAALKTWVAALDAEHAKAVAAGYDRRSAEASHAHHLLEALWVHQWHNVPNVDLLQQLLRSPVAEARAAATRVLCYWRDRVPGALALLQKLATDENQRVRLHAVRAASFFDDVAATNVALAATKLPIDYYLDYVIGETLRQLRPLWRKKLGEGATFAQGDPAATRYLLRTLSVAEIQKMPRTADVCENLLGRTGVPDAIRAEALAALAKFRHAAPVAVLLETIDSPAEIDVRNVGRLLVQQPAADLAKHRAALLKLGLADNSEGRSWGFAAAAVADGTLDKVWAEAAPSPLSFASLLGGIHLVPDAALRAKAYARVMPILAKSITEIEGPDRVVQAIQRDAIRCAVSSRQEPEKVFAALVSMIERGYEATTAAQGIRGLPRTSWTPAAAATAAKALVAWAAKTHASERTSRDYVETIQVADDLAGTLPAAESDALRDKLSGLRVAMFVVRAVPEGMKYDVPRIVVQAGRPFEIIFENPDVMPHNLVVVKPGTREKVGQETSQLAPDFTDRQGRAWVSESTDILAATKLLEPGRNETLRIPGAQIRDEGVYEYVCTFPGHWVLMWGQLVVTKNVTAYLKANPAPASPAAAPATSAEHKH